MSTVNAYTLSNATQKALVQLSNGTFDKGTNALHELRVKMGVIDVMYARFRSKSETMTEEQAYEQCASEFKELEDSFVSVDIPLLVSQVDTAVGYLAELYLSGSPIFPVVSDPSFRKTAEYIETLVDNYSRMGGYPRQLLMFFKDCIKYNVGPLHTEWNITPAWSYNLDNTDLDNAGTPSMKREYHGYMAIDRLDPYNTIFDTVVSPGSVALEGEYAGFVELYTPSKLASLIEKLQRKDTGYLVNNAKVFKADEAAKTQTYYYTPPDISKYITSKTTDASDIDWEAYMKELTGVSKRREHKYKGLYEVQTLYSRIDPKDYGINSPETQGLTKNAHRIYKTIVINGDMLLYLEPVYSPNDMLPILIGHPNEDGMKLQTQSVAESTMPMQAAVSTLTNIRFHAARRAISDRALYNSLMIDTADVNNPNPSGKIPVKTNTLTNSSLSDAYYSIPYDPRGTDSVIQDALMLGEWTNTLNGLNRAQQGQFQKGNKTREEFNTIMSNAEMRQRLPAIMLEFQVFTPLKQFIKLNISRFSQVNKIRSAVSGAELEMDINNLRNVVYDFKIADGYTPSSKLASTDLIMAGMQLIGSSEQLQLAYGPMLSEMFAHIMSLGGVKGLENYAKPAQPATGEPANGPNTQQPTTGDNGMGQ